MTAHAVIAFHLIPFCNPRPQSHKKVGTMWREAGLNWKDFLPEDEDVNKFVTEMVMSRPFRVTPVLIQGELLIIKKC